MSVAFVFPGQGSQSLGMQQELADTYPLVRKTYQEASDALGVDLWSLTREGPQQELDRTENTQPAVLCAGVAAWRVWCSRSEFRPAAMAGHSLGEYTALVCAGALRFDAALRLVAERGRLMQEAVPAGAGAMAVILGLEDTAVRELCAQAAGTEIVEAVNFNAPGQVVIAGHCAAVRRTIALAKDKGARRTMELAVSVPSHCALMRPAAEKLATRLADIDIDVPAIPVLHNVDVECAASPDGIRDSLVRQLYSPVRWVETILRLSRDGAGTVIECGPGKVLVGLVRRIDKSLGIVALDSGESVDRAIDVVSKTAGE